MDDEFFFILGNLEIPIIGSRKNFVWGVWVPLSRASFLRASKLWRQKGRETEPPYFDWLNTSLPGYPLSLKTNIHTRAVGMRAYVELEPTDHSLAIDQRQGITWARVEGIVALVLHRTSD